MQRDMKVGMALGVAIVGVVGALFFRREPDRRDDVPPPPLQETEQLDRSIAEKAHTPYLQGVEDFAEPPVPPAANVPRKDGVSKDAAKTKSRGENYKVPSFLTQDDDADQRALSNRPAAAPDPIQERDPVREAAPVAAAPPAHNADWEPVEQAGRKRPEPERGGQIHPANQSRTHVIKSGDTLSGLASRYLGSSARYRELYEANRDVLRSPDDLPDGVTIKIPESGSRKQTPATLTNGGLSKPRANDSALPREPDSGKSTDPPSAESGETRIRFAPVSRSPFSAGRSPAPAAATPPRKESKTPRLDLEDGADDFDAR